MSSGEGTDPASELVAAWIEDECKRTHEVHVSYTMRDRLACAIRLAFAARDAEIARLRAVTVAYWARFGAVPEDGANILAARDAEIVRLRTELSTKDEEIARLSQEQRRRWEVSKETHQRANATAARVTQLEATLRKTAVQLGGYVTDGEDGPVERCLYCGPGEDACLACEIHTFLGDEEYMNKGGKILGTFR